MATWLEDRVRLKEMARVDVHCMPIVVAGPLGNAEVKW